MSTVQSPKSIGTMEQYPKMPIAWKQSYDFSLGNHYW
jgi:hypothetical protein